LTHLIHTERIALVHSNTSHVISRAFAALFAGVLHLWQIREILIWKTFFAKPLKYFMNFSTCNVICVSDAALSSFDPPYTMADRVRVISDGIEVDKFLHAGQGGAGRFVQVWGLPKISRWLVLLDV